MKRIRVKTALGGMFVLAVLAGYGKFAAVIAFVGFLGWLLYALIDLHRFAQGFKEDAPREE